MVPPPKIYVFTLFLAISTYEHLLTTILPLAIVSSPSTRMSRIISSSPHKPTILKPNAAQYFNMVSGRPILKYWAILRFNMAESRSKIARGSWGGILDHGSWICYIEIQYGLNISIWPSLNPRSFQESRAILDLGSWIRHIEIQCVSIFQCGPLPILVFVFHGSCDSLHVHVCGSLHVHFCYMRIAKQLEATASFTLQPFMSPSRYSAWPLIYI